MDVYFDDDEILVVLSFILVYLMGWWFYGLMLFVSILWYFLMLCVKSFCNILGVCLLVLGVMVDRFVNCFFIVFVLIVVCVVVFSFVIMVGGVFLGVNRLF